MLLKEAKAFARQWVFEEASKLPGFYGAYFAGSTNWKADDAPLPLESDVDIKIVIDDEALPDISKTFYQGVTLNLAYIPSADFQTPEAILSSFHGAKHFTTPNIIADPSGKLAQVQTAVAEAYPRRIWVRKRCEGAQSQMLKSLQWLDPAAPFHDQVFAWIYPCSVSPQMIAVADLRNPTVRQTYIVARDVLAKYDRLDFHETLLTLLGSAAMTHDQVETLFAACREAFDLAKHYLKTPFFGSFDLTDEGKRAFVTGIEDMVKRGFHREAVFWIIVNHSWCQKALYNDAPPEILKKSEPGFQHLVSAVGIHSAADLLERHTQVQAFVPRAWEVTEAILAANPEIVD